MYQRLDRRDFLKISSAAGLVSLTGMAPPGEARATSGASWPFYAFDNGLTGIASPADQCKLLKDLGYDGIEYHLNVGELPRMLELLDKHGLKMFAIYTTVTLENPLGGDWGQWIAWLKGRETRIEMAIRSRTLKPSDPAGDAQAESLIKTISDLCADHGPTVSVYPHADMWTERVDDGIRLAKQVFRKNVGTNFNLVHWQWVKQSRQLQVTLEDALPYLLLVTINGLKGPAKSRQQIRPLDDSDYNVRGFLSLVRKVGYAGPVGLQCYNIEEPPTVHLKRSIEAWRTWK